MFMRKFWSLLLAVLMIVTLVACGGSSGSESESETEEPVSETAGSVSETTENESESSSGDMSFADALYGSGELDNYYFELIMEAQGEEIQNAKMWVMGQKMKFEAAGQITYYDFEAGTAAFYSKDTNQVIVMTVGETDGMDTPLSVEQDIDSSTYDSIYYQGTEDLDGKTVYVYDYSVAGYSATYYIWADNGILLKMETDANGYVSSYYFKDLTLNSVTESDFEYPAGASVLDMGG